MFDPTIQNRHPGRVCIICGGGTGAALAYDLVLRRIVPDTIEYNGGAFAALSDDEAAWCGNQVSPGTSASSAIT